MHSDKKNDYDLSDYTDYHDEDPKTHVSFLSWESLKSLKSLVDFLLTSTIFFLKHGAKHLIDEILRPAISVALQRP